MFYSDNNISKREISIKQFITPTNDFEDLKLTITSSSPVSIKGLKMLFFKRGSNSVSSKFGSRLFRDLGQSSLDIIRSKKIDNDAKVTLLCPINRREDIKNLIENL